MQEAAPVVPPRAAPAWPRGFFMELFPFAPRPFRSIPDIYEKLTKNDEDYPKPDQADWEDLAHELDRLRCTTKAFFTLSVEADEEDRRYGTLSYVALGAVATALSLSYCEKSGLSITGTAKEHFPRVFRSVNLVLWLLTAATPLTFAIRWYKQPGNRAEAYHQAGVGYNILLRRLESIIRIGNSEERIKQWVQYRKLRDTVEAYVSRPTDTHAIAFTGARQEIDSRWNEVFGVKNSIFYVNKDGTLRKPKPNWFDEPIPNSKANSLWWIFQSSTK